MNAGWDRARRIAALVRKESLQVVRDPSSLGIAFVLPIVLLVLFGYGVSLDAEGVPLAVVVEQPGPETARFVAGFEQSRFFRPRRMTDIREAQVALARREVQAVVWLRERFGPDLLLRRRPPIGVIVDGVNANQARLISGYVQSVWSGWIVAYARSRGLHATRLVDLEPRVWFNEAVASRDFLVPGLLAVIMTLIGALLTAMVIAREWERGTIESLFVTAVRPSEILIGKLLPYFGLGMGGMVLTAGAAIGVFGVPLRGSAWVLVAAAALFLLVALGMGLLISTVARNQFAAGQVAIVATFLPAFLLSGFIFDINSMPSAIRALTYLIPARYFVTVLQSVFLAGDVWPVIGPNLAALGAMAAVLLAVVRRRVDKRLE